VTQYAPELRQSKFEGALVERIRPDAGLAVQDSLDSTEIPGQPTDQTAQIPTSGAQVQDTGGADLGQPGGWHEAVGLAGWSGVKTVIAQPENSGAPGPSL